MDNKVNLNISRILTKLRQRLKVIKVYNVINNQTEDFALGIENQLQWRYDNVYRNNQWKWTSKRLFISKLHIHFRWTINAVISILTNWDNNLYN